MATLPPADLTGTRTLPFVGAPTPVVSGLDARQEVFHRLMQIAVGQQLQADVLSRFDDGTFLVKVADTPARMSLPVGTRVGDSLPMTLVATEPRPTFLIAAEAGSAPAKLSSAGRMIDNLLQVAQQQGGTPTAVIGKVPLVASPSAGTAQVAAALQDALTSSGLFYESHVQQWVNGGRPLTDLLREPQQMQSGKALPGQEEITSNLAQLANNMSKGVNIERPLQDLIRELQKQIQSGKVLPGQEALNTKLAQLASNMSKGVNIERPLQDLIRELQTLPGNALPTDADVILSRPDELPSELARLAGSGIDPSNRRTEEFSPESARLVSLQLNTLENHRVQWQGELWPGQAFEWEVSEDAPEREGSSEAAPPSSWKSVVRFELPTLGTVSATIHLAGAHVQVQVRTATEAAASSLRAHGTELAEALNAAGSPLDSLTVKQDGQT